MAGESNHGKSSFLNQLAWQVATKNEHVHVLDVTLDDTKLEKLCRLLALLSGLTINAVKRAGLTKDVNPTPYASMINAAVKVKKAMEEGRYQLVDAAEVGTVEGLAEYVRQRLIDVKVMGDDWKLVLFVDSFHDLIPGVRTTSDTGKYDYIAQSLSDLANEQDIPIVCTAELRKLNGQRRPVPDDIRESVKIRYEAKSILLCYNDVGARGEQADVYWYAPDDVAKYPVFEVHVAKNKFHSFKGRICFEFMPERALMREPDDAVHRKYLDIINTSRR